MTQRTVAGERADLLLEAYLQFEWKPARNGMSTVTGELEPRLAQPLVRAIMRVEAEFLLEDADHHGEAESEERTHDQRACDAFLALGLRVADAMNSTP